MDLSHFNDYADVVKQHTQRKKDTNKCPVLISKATWMNFGQTTDNSGKIQCHPNEVWLRYSYDATEVWTLWSKVSLLKRRKYSHHIAPAYL